MKTKIVKVALHNKDQFADPDSLINLRLIAELDHNGLIRKDIVKNTLSAQVEIVPPTPVNARLADEMAAVAERSSKVALDDYRDRLLSMIKEKAKEGKRSIDVIAPLCISSDLEQMGFKVKRQSNSINITW